MTTILTRQACTHVGIHGPDSEPGAVQRCLEETVALRVEQSIGKALDAAFERLRDEIIPALMYQAMREAWLEGGPTGVVLDPPLGYGRTQPWDAEGHEGMGGPAMPSATRAWPAR